MIQPLFTMKDLERAKHNGFAVGDTVWVRPNDAEVSKGKITGFQVVEPYSPIVKGKTPQGTKFESAFTLDRINPYKKGKYFKQWRYV